MDENKELNIAETEAENNMNEVNNEINDNPVSESQGASVSVQPNQVGNAQGQPNFVPNQPNFMPTQPNFAPNMASAEQVERVDPPFQAEGRPF